MTRGLFRFACSDGANARGLGALGALSDLELDLLVLLKGAEAAPLNFRVVDKHIGGAVLGSDKAEALLRVEPLHSSLWHLSYFPSLLTGSGPPTSGVPGPFRPLYLRGVVGTRPDLQPSQEPRSQRRSCGCEYTNTEAATAASQSCSGLRRQSRRDQVGNNSSITGSRRRAMADLGSNFGRELLACAVEGTDPDERP